MKLKLIISNVINKNKSNMINDIINNVISCTLSLCFSGFRPEITFSLTLEG